MKKKLPFYITRYQENWTTRTLKKGEMLLEAGVIAKRIYYIESGIVRLFIYNKKTIKEETSSFITENNVMIPLVNFLIDDKNPTIINVEVLEDAIIHSTTIEFWKEMEQKDSELLEFRNSLIMKVFLLLLEHNSDVRSLDATTHYKKLLAKFDFIERIKNEYVASYLGIDETTFSKIKSKIKTKASKKPTK